MQRIKVNTKCEENVMQATTLKSLIVICSILLSPLPYASSVSINWYGKIPIIDMPENLTINNGHLTWEMNKLKYSQSLYEELENTSNLTVTKTKDLVLISFKL